MPFIPHTKVDIDQMLEAIGINSVKDLFDEIPDELYLSSLGDIIPRGVSEMELTRIMRERALKDIGGSVFIGAGAYEHHIPAAVWDVTSRGEFLTAYTPYQAEASQGTLQLIYEYQTMMASLTGMDVSNASLYDGASALAEAVLMAVRVQRKSKSRRVLMLGTVNPIYRKVVRTLVGNQSIQLEEIPFAESGQIDLNTLANYQDDDITAIVIQQPNFFGQLEEVDAIVDWAKAKNTLVIAHVNPIAISLLKEPGAWGEQGADIVCGEGQPLGIPLASGGPYYGFMCCKQAYVRQMPGRIVGRTVDTDGKPGFTLTLQAREQHIRRSKATSNICTNQGLAVTASTIHMSILGAKGLQQVAIASHQNTNYLVDKLTAIDGVELVFQGERFHEAVIRTPLSAEQLLKKMAQHGVLAGYDLSKDYAELDQCILLCATETKNTNDLDNYVSVLTQVLNNE